MFRPALSRQFRSAGRLYCTTQYRLVLPQGGWLDLQTPTNGRPLALGESTFSADQLRANTPLDLPVDQFRIPYRPAMEALRDHPEIRQAVAT